MNPSGQNSKLKAPADPFTDNVKADIVAKPHQVRLRPHASALFTAAVPLDSRKRYHEPQRDKKKDNFRFPSNSKDGAIVEIAKSRIRNARYPQSFEFVFRWMVVWVCIALLDYRSAMIIFIHRPPKNTPHSYLHGRGI